MKNVFFAKICVFFFLAFVFSSFNSFASETYNLETNKSKIKWIGKKFLGSHWGWVKFNSGNLVLDGNRIVSAEFEVDMNSIENEDLKDPEAKNKLINHLKSDDFFSVAKFPTAKFVLTHSTPLKQEKPSDPNYAITGKITIKGITQTISFPAKINFENDKIKAKVKIDIDRTKFDVRFGSGSFFENLGDNVIYDNFTLELNLTFKK
ncbi:MAG: YceI family protein [Candidatus Kapaibacteriota bacterium]